MKQLLNSRIKSTLSYENEINEETVELAVNEANSIVGVEFEIITPYFLDIAFYRYLVLSSRSDLKEQFEDDYKIALKNIKRKKSQDSKCKNPKAIIGQRDSVW